MSAAEIAPFAKIAVALFVLVNPLEGVPVFMARSQHLDAAARAGTARTAAIAVTIVMLVSFFVGRVLLAGLGIRIGDFMIAGGLLIFLIGVKMVFGAPGDSFAIVPLAIPLLAGPGVISGVIVYASKGPTGNGCTPTDDAILSGIIVAVGVATWLALRAADPLRRMLGDTGINVSTRVSGLIVCAIAVEMVRSGLVSLFPALA
ncbi:MAG: MarC family protein [Candidatus Binatia bacterium]